LELHRLIGTLTPSPNANLTETFTRRTTPTDSVDSLRFDLSDKSSVAVGGSKLVFNFPDNNRKRRGGYNTFEDVVCSGGDSGWCFSGPRWNGGNERAGSCARPGSVPRTEYRPPFHNFTKQNLLFLLRNQKLHFRWSYPLDPPTQIRSRKSSHAGCGRHLDG
jgi:hypothetical protein